MKREVSSRCSDASGLMPQSKFMRRKVAWDSLAPTVGMRLRLWLLTHAVFAAAGCNDNQLGFRWFQQHGFAA